MDLRASIPIAKPIVYIDMDGVICDFEKRAREMKAISADGSVQKSAELFRDLEMIIGAKEAWDALQHHYECYILSSPSWGTPESYTEKRLWVEKYLGPTSKKKLILSHNKGLLLGDYLIDDRIANGVADFRGEHIHFGSSAFPDWTCVLAYLNKKATILIN